MRPDLLQAFQIITEFRVNTVGQDLRVFAVDDILLPVQEPEGDLELCWVLHDIYDSLQLIRVEFTGTVPQLAMVIRYVHQRKSKLTAF
jgi:hypothetical protein